MDSLFKNKTLLVLAIATPLVIAIVLFSLQQFNKSMTLPPQYKAIFATQELTNDGKVAFEFKVIDGTLKVTYTQQKYPRNASIYIFAPVTRNVEEYKIRRPALQNKIGETNTIPTPFDIKHLDIDPSRIAPDGFKFRDKNHKSGQKMVDIIGHRSGHTRFGLYKNGKYIPIEEPYNFYGHKTFIGWVIGVSDKSKK